MQGPRPVTSTHLIPPRVVAARRSGAGTGSVTTRRTTGASESSATSALTSSCDAALINFRASLHRDPLAKVPTVQEIQLRTESCKRQLETLELLLSTDTQRLTIMNDAAREVILELGLERRLNDKSDVVDPDLLTLLGALVSGSAQCGGDGSSVRVEESSRGDDVADLFSTYLCKYPRVLLSSAEAADVNAFADKVQETKDQVQLLEMLQLHESQSLGAMQERLRALVPHAGTIDAATGQGGGTSSSPNRHYVATKPITAIDIPALGSADAATLSGEASSLRLRPLWVKYFGCLDSCAIADSDATDDRRCCLLIEGLLSRITDLQESLRIREIHVNALQQQIDAAKEETKMANEATDSLGAELSASSEHCQELQTLLMDAREANVRVAREGVSRALGQLQAEESWTRQSIRLTEESQLTRIDNLQLRAFLVYASEQRQQLEEMLQTERQAAEWERQAQEEASRDKEDCEATIRELNEEMAAIGADRALQKAKVDMYQNTVRVDSERYAKSLGAIEADCNALRERVVQLEAQLDVQQSTSISKAASHRAVQNQKNWDSDTLVRQVSGKSAFDRSPAPRLFQPSSTPSATLLNTSMEETPGPRPRNQQPPKPTNH